MLGSGKDRKIEELTDQNRHLEVRNNELEMQSVSTEQLREALHSAREKLVDQSIILDRLTGQPLVYASVVAVETEPSQEFIETLLQPGVRVRVLRGRREGEVGTVVHPIDSDGDVVLKYDDGEQDYALYRPSVVARLDDLEPDADPLDPAHYVTGKSVTITHRGGKTQKGEFLEGPYRNNTIYVKTEDGGVEVNIDGKPHLVPENISLGYAVVAFEGKHLEVRLPEDKEVNPGDVVKLSMETAQIVDVASTTMPGEIAMVRRVIGDMSEVELQGTVHIVLNGRGNGLEEGDRVVLDASGSVILQNLGKDDERFRFSAETNVTWDDIGGLADAKKQMFEAIELPHRKPELYEFYGKKPVKGVLLYGPPGCGKTMLGKATATALAKIHGGNGSSNGFLYVKGPEILDRFVGVAEATIRQLFEQARKHKEEHGYPAVVFIDEADAILGKRGTGISSDIERTIVPMFLTEMDGLEDSGAVIILATNRSDVLDPAIVRDGRIDRKIKITRPDRQGAADIFELNLQGVPLHNGYSVTELAEVGADTLFSEEHVLYHITLKGDTRLELTLGDICNGGMVAGIVDQATSIAMHRDIEAGEQQGLRKEDLVRAVEVVFCQNLDLNHNDELADFTHDYREDVVGVRRLSQATN